MQIISINVLVIGFGAAVLTYRLEVHIKGNTDGQVVVTQYRPSAISFSTKEVAVICAIGNLVLLNRLQTYISYAINMFIFNNVSLCVYFSNSSFGRKS